MKIYDIFYHISVGTRKEKCPMCEGRKVSVYINGVPIYCKDCNGKGYIFIDGWKIDKCNYGRGYERYVVYKREIVNGKVIYNDKYNDKDCFATQAEAQAECDRRNNGK